MYTYAFLLVSDKLDLPEGICGSLELVRAADLAALVEPDLTFESLKHDRQLMQAVLSHDRVIQDLFQQTVVLPLRFGTYFLSREKLLQHLQSHQGEYLEKLSYLQGKAEYGLKLTPLPLLKAAPDADIDKLAKSATAQQVELQSLISLIKEHFPEAVPGKETNDGIERFYLLSAQQNAAQIQAHLQQWQQRCHCWELSLGEALPPYHFV